MFFMMYFLLNRIVARLNFHHSGVWSLFSLLRKESVPILQTSASYKAELWCVGKNLKQENELFST